MYFIPVAGAAWFGGLGPAIFCAILCTAAANLIFLDPKLAPSLDASNLSKTLLYFSEAVLVASLSRNRRQSHLSAVQRRLLYDATLNAVSDAVITTNVRGQIESMNAAARAITGWTIEDAKDRVCGSVVRFHASVHPVAEALESGLAYHSPQPMELIRRNQSKALVEVSVLPVMGPGGDVCGAVLTLRDRTSQLAVQRGLEKRVRQLEQQSAADPEDTEEQTANHS